jgi:MoaA/NifB/PqqE/SkfB family radical SAM enzyme
MTAAVEPSARSHWGALPRRALPLLQLGTRRLRGQRSPFQMTLSLTNRCNFRCDYCHIPLDLRKEMTTQEWCAAIDELHTGGMQRVSLMGGEPLLRDDAGEIIRHLKGLGLHTSMNTNGWFIEERLEELRSLDLVCLTLDGPPEVHDGQRRKGSYERVLKAIEALRGVGVPVVTMTVVTTRGAETVEHVLDVAKRFDISAFFQIEHDAGMDVQLPVGARFTSAGIVHLAEHLLKLKDAGQPVGNSRSALAAHMDRGRYLSTCDDCQAGSYFGYVLSDGTVAPCIFTQRQVEQGNGRKYGFLKAFHEAAAPTGPGCSCVPSYEVNRMLALDPAVLWNALGTALRRSA